MAFKKFKEKFKVFGRYGKHLINIILERNPLEERKINKYNVIKNRNRKTEVFTVSGHNVEWSGVGEDHLPYNYTKEDLPKTTEVEMCRPKINASKRTIKCVSMDAVKPQQEKNNHENTNLNIGQPDLDRNEQAGIKIAEKIGEKVEKREILDFGDDPVSSVEDKLEILTFDYSWADVMEQEEMFKNVSEEGFPNMLEKTSTAQEKEIQKHEDSNTSMEENINLVSKKDWKKAVDVLKNIINLGESSERSLNTFKEGFPRMIERRGKEKAYQRSSTHPRQNVQFEASNERIEKIIFLFSTEREHIGIGVHLNSDWKFECILNIKKNLVAQEDGQLTINLLHRIVVSQFSNKCCFRVKMSMHLFLQRKEKDFDTQESVKRDVAVECCLGKNATVTVLDVFQSFLKAFHLLICLKRKSQPEFFENDAEHIFSSTSLVSGKCSEMQMMEIFSNILICPKTPQEINTQARKSPEKTAVSPWIPDRNKMCMQSAEISRNNRDAPLGSGKVSKCINVLPKDRKSNQCVLSIKLVWQQNNANQWEDFPFQAQMETFPKQQKCLQFATQTESQTLFESYKQQEKRIVTFEKNENCNCIENLTPLLENALTKQQKSDSWTWETQHLFSSPHSFRNTHIRIKIPASMSLNQEILLSQEDSNTFTMRKHEERFDEQSRTGGSGRLSKHQENRPASFETHENSLRKEDSPKNLEKKLTTTQKEKSIIDKSKSAFVIPKDSFNSDESVQQKQHQNDLKEPRGISVSEKSNALVPNQRCKTLREKRKASTKRKSVGKQNDVSPIISMLKKWLWILLILALFKFGGASTDCDSANKQPVLEVTLCPTSQYEWEEKSIACRIYQDNCTRELKYHCVINADGTKFVQVCAPNTKITQTFCPEYNSGIRSIQPHLRIRCDSCLVSYDSSEGYKHPECLNRSILRNFNEETVVPRINTTATIGLNHIPPVTGNQSLHTTKQSSILFKVSFTSAYMTLVFLSGIVVCFVRKRQKYRDKNVMRNTALTEVTVQKQDKEIDKSEIQRLKTIRSPADF